ncbi:MAG: VPLPA-CTERM sorting domain-containing protein, partial [Pseudomonadales bacterium]|nr:VPLPA-CTERM sorting domain-containing protein [Pseudomonadales bacterium]
IKNHNPHTPPDKPDPPEVPLPASAYLFGSALLGLGAIGRRRNHAKRA